MVRPLFFTISEQIADDIRKGIIFGNLTEGTPLREIELSKQYNVSRGPVRDALKELAKEGFLDMIPNVGVKVAKAPSDDTLELIIRLRKDLEHHAILHVYDSFDREAYKELEELLEMFRLACETNNLDDVINLDMAFHKYLIDKMADNHISDMWQSVVNRMLFRYHRFTNLMDSYEEHHQILEALKRKDKDQILEVLDKNIQ